MDNTVARPIDVHIATGRVALRRRLRPHLHQRRGLWWHAVCGPREYGRDRLAGAGDERRSQRACRHQHRRLRFVRLRPDLRLRTAAWRAALASRDQVLGWRRKDGGTLQRQALRTRRHGRQRCARRRHRCHAGQLRVHNHPRLQRLDRILPQRLDPPGSRSRDKRRALELHRGWLVEHRTDRGQRQCFHRLNRRQPLRCGRRDWRPNLDGPPQLTDRRPG